MARLFQELSCNLIGHKKFRLILKNICHQFFQNSILQYVVSIGPLRHFNSWTIQTFFWETRLDKRRIRSIEPYPYTNGKQTRLAKVLFKSTFIPLHICYSSVKYLSVNRKDLIALTLVGLTWENPALDPLAVLNLDNRLTLYIKN